MIDFPVDTTNYENRGRKCNSCLGEEEFEEYNNKINQKPLIIKKMATLKEKRAAEAAAKLAGTTVEATTENVVAPKSEKPVAKVGDTTKDGLKVVGEKVEPTKVGRKSYVEKPIEQLNPLTLEVVATFKTLKEAVDAVGTNNAYLLDGLRGWAKTVAKHKWRYVGEELVVREKKVKTEAELAFVKEGKKKKDVVEDIPVPGDLDYDAELHAPKPVVEEEETDAPEDKSVFDQDGE